MDQGIYLITLVGTALVLFAAFSSLIAFRFGAPLLLIFLGIGLAAGTDGLGLDFDNAALAYFIGSLALAVILFDSGFGTSFSSFRQAAAPALVLATIGVVMTAGLVGVATYYVTDFTWLEAFLLGATVASTDAAAVFFLLRVGNISVRERVRSTLEVESGSNDPIAIFLTLSLVSLISSGEALQADTLATDIALGFLQQMGIGLVAGVLGGYAIVRLVMWLKLEQGLLPIFVLALSLLVFALAGAMGGSGFLAVYVAGLIAGSARLRSTALLKRFQDGVTWLAQIIMFLVLGLFATPSQFAAIALPALFIGLFLIFVARPLAVMLCLLPFRFAPAENAFISWVGLRGAVSILLAITPLIDGLENGRPLFNIVFIIVLVSLVVQGWSVGPLARRLALTLPPRMGPLNKVELELPGSARHELLAYRVVAGSPVERGQRIPRWAKPSLVVRDGRSMTYQYAGRLSAGDHVYIFVPDRYPRLLDRLFASPVAMDPEDAEFFGAFAVDPDRPASDIEAAYAPGLSEEEQQMTIADLVRGRLGGRAEYGDRATLGSIELIVRDVDEDGKITAIGLSLEPPASTVRVPMFLSPGDLLRRLFRRGTNGTPG
ncbi:potassium/proton antiporter [Nitratireductor pacificus]|uniref:Potassium/proton antiporter n=1 Tax=Nitratireductor pacificus pht-3B TaxID=391937 RepID=K2M9D3_9HYPH|nr:potassium/proton antiporter [Nitratireductor pacificus]EKF18731.1 potassium/proton antiporter [Nitratireductor pacificus pht-3B]